MPVFILASVFLWMGSLSGLSAVDVEAEWKGKPRSASELGESTSASVVSAVQFWSDWAERLDYRMLVTDDAEVLVLWPQENRSARKILARLRETTERMNARIPMPVQKTAKGPGSAPPGFAPEEVFEDWKSGEIGTSAARPWNWGEAGNPPDSDVIVLGHFRNMEQYADALNHLARHFPYLRSWVERGTKVAGCVLERPLFGAVVAEVPGIEEWSVEHEWVHRVAQLKVLRRFGQQPIWMTLGLAWNVELELEKSIYCFPYRSGFVSVSEHTGWDRSLKKLLADRGQPLRMFDLASCHRNEFDRECALLAWGMVRFLITHHPDQLPLLLREFGTLRQSLGREYQSYSSWTLDGDYEVPNKDQEEAVRRIVAPDALQQFSDWVRMGRRWKKPR